MSFCKNMFVTCKRAAIDRVALEAVNEVEKKRESKLRLSMYQLFGDVESKTC